MYSENERFSALFVGERKNGKTTELIKRAVEKDLPILVHSRNMKTYLLYMIEALNIGDVKVLTVDDLSKGKRYERVIIDEPQLFIEHLLRVNVDAMAISSYNINNLGARKECQD